MDGGGEGEEERTWEVSVSPPSEVDSDDTDRHFGTRDELVSVTTSELPVDPLRWPTVYR